MGRNSREERGRVVVQVQEQPQKQPKNGMGDFIIMPSYLGEEPSAVFEKTW